MPVAVPTGDYDVECRVDLAPCFGTYEFRRRLHLTDPGPEALDRCLARAHTGAVEARRAAVEELQWFDEDADVVVQALVALLEDGETNVRAEACYSLRRFPEQAAAHYREYLKLALKAREWDRSAALYLVGEVAPDEPIVRRVLDQVSRSGEPGGAEAAKRALEALSERGR